MTTRSPRPPKRKVLVKPWDAQARQARKDRQLRPLQPRTTWLYDPKKNLPHKGETVSVIKAPRLDVASPGVRVRFEDGTEEVVPAGRLKALPREVYHPHQPDPEAPPPVQDARERPAWIRLLNLIDERQDAGDDGQPVADLEATIAHRLAQLAGMVAPKDAPAEEKNTLALQLRAHAELDAAARRAQAPGRAGKGRPAREVLPEPTGLPPEFLEQEERRMINAVAKSIHRRYFISDREQGGALRIPWHVRALIREAGRSQKHATEVPQPHAPRASELHRQAADSWQEMMGAALEICQLLARGQDQQARLLLGRQQQARVSYTLARRQIEALRPQVHTGRFFHGDILSVRDEHAEFDPETGDFLGYHGMTQYYTRLTVVYAEDGYHVTVANTAELESRTATRAGDEAWRDLCRWIEDTSDRREGKRQGRRQDDDEHLIFRENEGTLRLREQIQERYPRLVDALEVIRRSLEPEASDVLDSEIPGDDRHPGRGYHPYEKNDAQGGLDKMPSELA